MQAGCHVNRCHADPHASITAHIRAARAEAEAECGIHISAVQIFVSNPRQLSLSLEPGAAAELRDYIRESGVAVFAHSSYVAAPFAEPPAGDAAVAFIHRELAICADAGICGLVIHLPKLPLDEMLARITELTHPACAKVMIYLETPAVCPGNAHYETGPKLVQLYRGLRKIDPDCSMFGICIDTAHLWTSGIDISSLEQAMEWLDGLDGIAEFNSDAPRIMFHANDSLRKLGQGPDAHAGLTKGRIWSEYADTPSASGLAAFAAYATANNCPFILERKPKEALYSDYRLLLQLQPDLHVGAHGVGAHGGGAHGVGAHALFAPLATNAELRARVAASIARAVGRRAQAIGISAESLAAKAVADLATLSDAAARTYLAALLRDAAAAAACRMRLGAKIVKAITQHRQVIYLDIGSGLAFVDRLVRQLGLSAASHLHSRTRGCCECDSPTARIVSARRDGAALPYPDGTFSLITISHADEFKDARALFAELRRVAQPGAQLLLIVPALPAAAPLARVVQRHYEIIAEMDQARAGTLARARARLPDSCGLGKECAAGRIHTYD